MPSYKVLSGQALTRRGFLRLSAMAAVSVLAASCAPSPRPGDEPEPFAIAVATVAERAPVEYKEPPSLLALVESGDLPPVNERLPSEPLVVDPLEAIGRYGGRLRMLDARDYGDILGPGVLADACYERPIRWNRDASALEPNILRGWDVEDDGQAYMLYLRKGLKWSDGEPCTTDDLLFFLEDYLANEGFTSATEADQFLGAVPAKVERIDPTTLYIRFAAPNVFFLHHLAMRDWVIMPKHYLIDYHPDYASDEFMREQASGYGQWRPGPRQVFYLKANLYGWGEPGCPTLRAWRLTNSRPASSYSYERNPYYWKIDTDGNQLPYIDTVQVDLARDAGDIEAQVANGTVDLQQSWLDYTQYAKLKASEERGGYIVHRWDNPTGSNLALFLNQNASNTVLRELNRDVRWRTALSIAINRDEINQVLYDGIGEARQATVASSSPIYKTEYARANAEYDPDRARKVLDELGLTGVDVMGSRTGPGGEVLSISIGTDQQDDATQDLLRMIVDYWEALGVRTSVQTVGSFGQSGLAQGIESGIIGVAVGVLGHSYYPFVPINYVPVYQNTAWAPGYGRWYLTKGEEGEEPPAEIKELQETWEQISVTVDRRKQIALFQRIFDLHAQNCWIIGTVGEVPNLVTANARLRNLPRRALSSPEFTGLLGAARLEQLWYEA